MTDAVRAADHDSAGHESADHDSAGRNTADHVAALTRTDDPDHLRRRFAGGVLRGKDDAMMQRILAAAVEAFAEKGFNGTNIRDIGARGGMSSGSLYNHFDSKADILATIMLRGITNLVSLSERALAQAGDDPGAQLDALVEVHVGLHAAYPRESAIGNAELHNLDPGARSAIVDYRDRQERLFLTAIRAGVEQRAFTTDEPREAARFVIVACTGIARWFRAGQGTSVDTIIRTYQKLARSTVGER